MRAIVCLSVLLSLSEGLVHPPTDVSVFQILKHHFRRRYGQSMRYDKDEEEDEEPTWRPPTKARPLFGMKQHSGEMRENKEKNTSGLSRIIKDKHRTRSTHKWEGDSYRILDPMVQNQNPLRQHSGIVGGRALLLREILTRTLRSQNQKSLFDLDDKKKADIIHVHGVYSNPNKGMAKQKRRMIQVDAAEKVNEEGDVHMNGLWPSPPFAPTVYFPKRRRRKYFLTPYIRSRLLRYAHMRRIRRKRKIVDEGVPSLVENEPLACQYCYNYWKRQATTPQDLFNYCCRKAFVIEGR